jgi:hypothetical protein
MQELVLAFRFGDVNGLDRARDIVIDAHHPISPLLES